MKCSHCGNETVAFKRVVMVELDLDPYPFCNRACLRAWLAPDRPIYEPVEQAQNAALSPQHIVVGPVWRCPKHGEISEQFCKSVDCVALSNRAQLR